MNANLETLLELQDMRTQRRELSDSATTRQVEEEVFGMGIDEALRQLDAKIEEVENALPPAVRSRYARIANKDARPVVPVIGGTCYGCFVSIPTAVASGADRNEKIRNCDSCGRFLYLMD